MDEETEEGMAEEFPEEDTQPINEETEDYYDNEEEGEEPEELVPPEEEVRGRKKRRKGSHDHHGEDSERRESRKRRWRDENEERHRSRQRSGEVGYEFSERRRSGEHSDFETEGRSHRKRRSEDREGKSSRRKHHKHRREKSRKSKSRLDDSRSSQEMEQEEGELEDGEIDEEEDNDEQEHFIDDGHDDIHHDSRKKYERENSDGNYKMEGNYEEEEDGDSSEEHNQDMWKGRNHGNRDHQKENKRGSRGRGRRDDRRGGKMGRGGRKSQGRYHDYDNVEDDQPWMSSKTKRSGKQRSPVGNHRHGDKYDRRGERFEEGPFESPPGPYDSPSDEESVDEYGERRGKTKKSQSMLSMLGDDMLDPNIAVEEGQDLYKRKVKNKRKNNEQGGAGRQDNRDRNRGERGDRGFKRKQNKEYMEEYSDQPKKKPLLQTPMEERPICRFFKEGKCQKGYDCPFNHDTVPDKKPELCKYYLNSYCSKGENCIFMHSEYPCKFYHTGQECYGGDDCKFSHDPLTDETRHLIEKNVEVEDRQQAKRPSLLGSPPRHLKMDPEMQERIKKIPSIFDIEVFPPGQSPKKPPNQQGQLGPPPPNRMQGPPPQNMMGPPQRPAGFYTEMNQGRMPRPGMMGPPVSGQGPMSMPPPMHMGPPPGPMGPPGPMNQGPPMGPPRGPMAPGPMNQMNPAMNPAVALVGALLQHAAGARPPLRVPNAGQQGPMQGLSMPPPMTQGPQATPEGYGPNLFQENPMGAQQFENNDNSENQEQDSKDGGSGSNNQQEVVNEESKPSVDPNQAKLAKMGLEPTSLNYLPSKQKELFLRINKTVGEENSLQEGSIQSIKSKTEDQVSQDREEKDDADDNWYSSDEEDATGKDVKPKLTDILKNLNKQASTPESPQITTPPNTSSTLNIMQMINAIKTGAGTGSATSPISSPTSMPRDPRQRNDPRTGRSGGPAVIPTEGPEVKVEPTTFINSYEGDIAVYRLVPVAKNPDSKLPPKGLDLTDAQFKNDPRVQKMLKQTEATKGQTFETNAESVKNSVKDSSKLTDPRSNAERPTDPRSSNTGSTDRPSDPRMKGSSDPRIQKTVSDTGVSKPHDPRLSRAQSSPLTSGASATDPRMGRHAAVATMQDPRMLGRQISRDGNSDPRIGRQLSNQTNSSYENLIVNQTGDSKAVDPRFSSQSSGSSDPRQQNRQNLSLDPRTKQNSLSDPRPRVQVDPKLDLLADPRMKPDMDISSLKPLDPKIIQSSLEENADAIASQLSVPTDSMENDNLSSSTIDGGDKPKLDYRNDPRFKRKPAGKRKSSMDYASPLGDEGNQENSSPSYSAYARAPINKQSKPELKSRSDPRLANSIVESTSVANDSSLPPQSTEQLNLLNLPLPELPPFIPPPEPEINTKDFFKTMDPTASPFC